MFLSHAQPTYKRPYDDYYRSRFIASVRFDNGQMIVEDGKRELNKAKSRTEFCYVKDIQNGVEVRLELVDNNWVRV